MVLYIKSTARARVIERYGLGTSQFIIKALCITWGPHGLASESVKKILKLKN